MKTDAPANDGNKPAIHAADSTVKVYVIKTDEELMMAQHVKKVLAPLKPATPTAKPPAP